MTSTLFLLPISSKSLKCSRSSVNIGWAQQPMQIL